ncbi:LacI family transcriptional regulator [Bifidobacterium ramosum]|uniref:DUF1648 domain-containing protein n=1 Tax=Bifidobacterium ramosum TaxID=1798158 RepID=A0A6L4X4A5_9BIFI|nr:DUF5808 domain-containing protein [Bifidobacterium ramosum]KAB8289007.1 LacI family transcriptional regulator [Bifidobacterium ramosum]NEG70721.1 DUF1648 domain-containing protein [Bifidobacterium ramosum]
MNDTNTTMNVILGTTFLLPILVTISLTAVPWITDRHDAFGVTVPPAAHADPDIRRLKRGFSWSMAASGIIATAISLAVWQWFGIEPAIWTISAVSVALTLVGFTVQQICRRRTRSIAVRRNWHAGADRRAAIIGEHDNPEPISLTWEWLHLVALAVTVLVGVLGYGNMPERVAIHENMAGQIDGWANKSPWLILMAVPGQIIVAMVLIAAHVAIIDAKKPIDPDHPATTGFAYGTFARVWSIYTLVIGLLVAGWMGLGVQLVTVGVIGIDLFATVAMLLAVVALIGVLVISVYCGQNGSRFYAGASRGNGGPESDDVMSVDDDRHWIDGVFYMNRDDPAIWVPKRFGVGWTVNCARPVVWLAAIGLIAVTVAPVVLALI